MQAYGQPSPDTALLVEMIGGLFGFLGLGRIYAGRTVEGLVFLIGWWLFIAVEIVLSLFLIGLCLIGLIGLCLIGLCLLPLNVLIPIVSGITLRDSMRRTAF